MTFDFYGKSKELNAYKIVDYFLGPWDEKTGVFAPLYHQSYQVESESLRNVVSGSIDLCFLLD
jgi:hypothetical protein